MKLSFAAIAAVLAIAFSAFVSQKEVVNIYYESSPGVFTQIPPSVTPCEEGTREQCEVEIDGHYELLWLDAGFTPYKRK